MGLIQAFTGALGGTFADQWLDYVMPASAPQTAGLIPAITKGKNNGRGSNTKGSDNIITNGSKIIVPEGYCLITLQDGGVTGVVTQSGGYEFRANDMNSKSIFAGDGFVDSLIKQSWERFKYGGQPGSQQQAYYINLKPIPNNRFGTQSEIYWDDAYMNAQVGAMVRGTYTLQIIDPVAFINYIPTQFITGNSCYDFDDMDNDSASQFFNEFVGSLSSGFSMYTNDPSRGNRITKIQSDQMGFAKCLSSVVEQDYAWESQRGIRVISVAIQAIEYDEDSKKLLSDVKKADALSGARGNSFMQQSMARGMQAMGENGGGGAGMAMFGMGAGMMNQMGAGMYQQPQAPYQNPVQQNMFGGMQQPMQQQYGQPMQQQPMQQATPQGEDPMARLQKAKGMLDAGLITPEEFAEQKARILNSI